MMIFCNVNTQLSLSYASVDSIVISKGSYTLSSSNSAAFDMFTAVVSFTSQVFIVTDLLTASKSMHTLWLSTYPKFPSTLTNHLLAGF